MLSWYCRRVDKSDSKIGQNEANFFQVLENHWNILPTATSKSRTLKLIPKIEKSRKILSNENYSSFFSPTYGHDELSEDQGNQCTEIGSSTAGRHMKANSS